MIQAWKKNNFALGSSKEISYSFRLKKIVLNEIQCAKLVKSVNSSIEAQFLKLHHESSAKNSICVKKSVTNRIFDENNFARVENISNDATKNMRFAVVIF